jgi:hypothetical protein
VRKRTYSHDRGWQHPESTTAPRADSIVRLDYSVLAVRRVDAFVPCAFRSTDLAPMIDRHGPAVLGIPAPLVAAFPAITPSIRALW